ncbi:type VI secretion system lipoprotein TssJ, partial [Pantoea agglomerans]|uniref:type VI secretion system lipoprotein TssJ n=1 Tax=Enterobacter agglomerans TaxID=549 RepID=UPI001A8CAE86
MMMLRHGKLARLPGCIQQRKGDLTKFCLDQRSRRLLPGEMRSIFLSTENKVQALGIIGAYRDLNDAVWLKIYELPP